MRVNIFDIDATGACKITKHIQEIWYFKELLNNLGEQNALKLFKVFYKCHDLNPKENIFANLPEDSKLETVLRATYPELAAFVDFEDELVQMAYDLVGECYDTTAYRAHKAVKTAYDKMVYAINFMQLSLEKDSGNTAELQRALKLFDELDIKYKQTFKDLEEELNIVTLRGGRTDTDRRAGGKQIELE